MSSQWHQYLRLPPYPPSIIVPPPPFRTYKLPCSGVGILPALELSENTITFAATPVNDRSTATISVCNPRLSRLNSAVIRGAVSAQGPKMFEFVLPEGSPFSVCPKVATLKLGQVWN